MSKKGLISSLIIGLVVTLALGIYTIVSVFAGPSSPAGPVNTNINLAFRTGDVINVFDGYSEEDGTLKFSLSESTTESPITKNEDGKYTATKAGELTAVVSLDKKGNTNTYLIKVYDQGDGMAEETPYIIASKAHLVEFRDTYNEPTATFPKYTKIVSDIDLGDENWKPIGYAGHEFDGVIDGDNFTISNVKISITLDNYADFFKTCRDQEKDNAAYLDLGLFGAIKGSKINCLNVSGAEITVSEAVYNAIHDMSFEGLEYSEFARLTAGAMAGVAIDSDIVGGEVKNEVVSRISGFSFSNPNYEMTGDEYANGLGGMVGVGRLVRISNYSVKTTIINNVTITRNESNVRGSRVGGVVGYINSASTLDGVTLEKKNKIDNVEVSFYGSLFYETSSKVGGIAGEAADVEIINSSVVSFTAIDDTDKGVIDFNYNRPTMVAGVVADIYSNANDEYASKIENVVVAGLNVSMRGSYVGGIAYLVGTNSDQTPVTIVDSTASGKIIGKQVAGLVYQLNAGSSITYTEEKAIEVVADVELGAFASAGLVFYNFGVVTGYEKEVQSEAVEGEEPVVTIIKPIVRVNTTGFGAEPSNSTVDSLYALRTNAFAAGLVGVTYRHNSAPSILPEISKFVVEVTAVSSINYAGVVYSILNAKVSNIDVNATFTSHTAKDASGESFSTSYMFAGVANLVGQGTTIEHCKVILNANKDKKEDAANAYAGSYVGGLVSRYLGDDETSGLTLSNNVVSGEVYFNSTYHTVGFESEQDENVYEGINDDGVIYTGIFAAGGLIGAISQYSDVADGKYDKVKNTPITHTTISNNEVKDFIITAKFDKEAAEMNTTSIDKYLNSNAYRLRGIGAAIGIVLSETEIGLATNKVSGVEIRAYAITFTYQYGGTGDSGTRVVCLGANKEHTVGITYLINTKSTDLTNECDEFLADDETQVKYVELGQAA